MINKILISTLLVLNLVCYSQESSSSPYSFYGLGELRFNGNVESRTMGGISILPDSTRINFQNPASFGNLKWTSFSTAISTDNKKQKSSTAASSTNRTTLDYISVAIPLGKFGAGFGVVPYSSVGYRIKNTSDVSQTRIIANGSGGVQKVFLGTGYQILPNLSIGVAANYKFGKISTSFANIPPDLFTGSRESITNDLSGFDLNLGLMYQQKLKGKLSLFSSLSYTNETTLNAEIEKTTGTVILDSNDDYIAVDNQDTRTSKFDYTLPEKWNFGIGVGNIKNWALGLDLSFQNRTKEITSTSPSSNFRLKQYQRYGLGGYYQSNSNYYSSYYKKIIYRGGLVYEKTGLLINSTAIEDIGLTFGFGLPISGSLSNLNVGLQLGKKGTIANGLVQENYFVLNIGLSFNDKWFVKSKYR